MNGLKYRDITKLSNPVGVDVAIQNIQEALEVLPWLEKSYGKALIYTEERNETTEDYVIPKTYYKKGEYTPLDPDDTVKSYSFMYEDDPTNIQGFGKTRLVSTLNLVVFANLELINSSNDELFLETLLNDVLTILNNRSNSKVYQSIIDYNGVFKWLPNAFSDFTVSTNKKYLKENYAAFRINFDVAYIQIDSNCI